MNMLYPHSIPARVMVPHLLTQDQTPAHSPSELRCAALSSGGCGLAGERENLRGTYIELKMQEVSQHSGGHAGEGGQECLEVDLQILLPLFHQAS